MMQIPLNTLIDLPSRDAIANAYRIVGQQTGAISIDPAATALALSSSIPPLMLFLLALACNRRDLQRHVPKAIMVLVILLGFLGSLQFLSQNESGFFVYGGIETTAVGFFSNPNHFALFLAMSVPLAALVVARARRSRVRDQKHFATLLLGASAAFIAVVCMLLSRSMAGFGFAILSMFSFAIIVLAGSRSVSRFTGLIALIALFICASGVIVVQYTNPNLGGLELSQFFGNELSRAGMAETTIAAIGEFQWLGSGLGSFEAAIGAFEDRNQVTSVFINHAHNEPLQLVMELGIAGVILLFAVIAGWAMLIWRAWSPSGALAQKAVSLSLMFLLLHSLIDYPARTPAIAGFTMVLVALALTRQHNRVD